MDLSSLILIALFVIIGIFLYKLIHKIATFIVTMVMIGCLVFGVLVYLDYNNITDSSGSELFVFMGEGKVHYAAEVEGFNLNTSQELSKAERIRLEGQLASSDLEPLLNTSTRIVLVNDSAYEESYAELVKQFKQDTPYNVALGVRNGTVEVYPNSLYFWFIRRVPARQVQRLS